MSKIVPIIRELVIEQEVRRETILEALASKEYLRPITLIITLLTYQQQVTVNYNRINSRPP